jgi:hypothetical protein
MRRVTFLLALFGFAVGTAIGVQKPESMANAGQPPVVKSDSPNKLNPLSKEDPKAKDRLVEVEKAIAAKEKELAALRVEADTLRKQLASDDRPYTNATDMFKNLPKESYPMPGKDGVLERAAADKWLKANIVGKAIEWTATINKVVINEPTDDLFFVKFALDLPLYQLYRLGDRECLILGEPIVIGDQKCLVLFHVRNFENSGDRYSISYPRCTAEEAKHLRDLKGKKVTFHAPIISAFFASSGAGQLFKIPDMPEPIDSKYDLACVFTIDYPTADGFKPTIKLKGKR